MSLNNTPSANRTHIGIFGRRNAGKSSLINALTGQNLAIVSDIEGTTTDPVQKAMELLPLGPVVIIDTPGLDDVGELGAQRVRKTKQVLNKTDIALLVVDAGQGMTAADEEILRQIQKKGIPHIVVFNKADLLPPDQKHLNDGTPPAATSNLDYASSIASPNSGTACPALALDGKSLAGSNAIAVSAATGKRIQELKELIARLIPDNEPERHIVRDLVRPLDFVILVVPIDSAAPKGRLILPQQQTIRDLLESEAVSIVVKETELAETLHRLGRKPDLVITDSQAFEEVANVVPNDVSLTSFSILFARYKGNLETVVQGARELDKLEEDDHILICEGCTHHRQCDDIGTVKLPRLIRAHCGKRLHFDFTSGGEFPSDLNAYRLIIHCGGCTLNEREMKYRLQCAADQNVPITNYGTAIAHMKGILERSTKIFHL